MRNLVVRPVLQKSAILSRQPLAGMASELNEYNIGISVFARPATFDLRTDAVLRSEARRLGSKLAEHHQVERQEL